LSRFYANITLQGPGQDEVVGYLTERGAVAYVAPTAKGGTVVFHEDLAGQEDLTALLSGQFRCPALLVMAYGEAVLLYHLYADGGQVDAYVSSPHEDLETDGQPMPEGNAEVLCKTFGMEHRLAGVTRILNRPTKPNTDFALAANRHGELARALGLPLFAAGAGYQSIEIGELPAGQGFDATKLVKTGAK
jgi:hypothetical protein